MDTLFGWLSSLALVAIALVWVTFFPEARDALWQRLQGAATWCAGRAGRLVRRWARSTGGYGREAGAGITHLAHDLARHWLLIVAILVILALPATLVLVLHQHVMLQGYDMTQSADQDTAQLVAGLLRGEQLVPPPPLPPAVFVTPEVERIRPELGGASRKWDQLNADFRQRLLVIFKIMRERYGYDMALLEGYRSPQRQAQLAAQGSSVTQAGPFQSYHQYGLAADCAFYRNGKLVIADDTDWARRGYQLYGKVATSAGLVWGGNWKSLRDLGHVELHLPGMGPKYHH